MGLGPYERDPTEIPSPLHYFRTWWEGFFYEPENKPLPSTKSGDTAILGFQSLELQERNSIIYKPLVCSILLQELERANTTLLAFI